VSHASIKYVGQFCAFRHAQITATLACGERTQSIVTVLPKYTKIVSAVAIPFQVGVEMAVTFVQFVRPENSFDPELVATLIAAYDKAVASLHDNGQPQVVRESWQGASSKPRKKANVTLIACATRRS
jgi:hypothetical protein